jgi:hypothetical protein
VARCNRSHIHHTCTCAGFRHRACPAPVIHNFLSLYISLMCVCVCTLIAQSVLVVRDVQPSAHQLGHAPNAPPLLVSPLGYAPVWTDEGALKQGSSRFLRLWRPVTPPGYVAMGCVVGLGTHAPPVGIVRCVSHTHCWCAYCAGAVLCVERPVVGARCLRGCCPLCSPPLFDRGCLHTCSSPPHVE